MKAVAVFPHTHEVKFIEHEAPHITELDHVKVRVLDVGICGTDKRYAPLNMVHPRRVPTIW